MAWQLPLDHGTACSRSGTKLVTQLDLGLAIAYALDCGVSVFCTVFAHSVLFELPSDDWCLPPGYMWLHECDCIVPTGISAMTYVYHVPISDAKMQTVATADNLSGI